MRSPLDLDLETMRRHGHAVADLVAEHLAGLRSQPVCVKLDPNAAARLIDGPAPRTGRDLESILETFRSSIVQYSAREPHPHFMGYIPSSPTFPAVLGDWLASGFNFFAGVWAVAAGPNQVELTVLEWFREWVGMPRGTSGLLTSGGSAATLTAVIAARHAAVGEGEDAARIGKLTLYTSDQAHSSVARAAWTAGLSRANVRLIPTDNNFAMRTDALGAAIRADREAGLVPLMIAASAGTTNTGAVDPLAEIAAIARQEKLWLHVDAAYAGFAALTSDGAQQLAGIELADTVTLDPHKWLFVPFECGCLLARDPAMLESAFRIMPDYLHDVASRGVEVNFADRGEQLTRVSRALKVWVSVNYFGVDAIAEAIQRAIDLAKFAEVLIGRAPRLEILSPARFGIVCFRSRGSNGMTAAQLDAENERINDAVNATGRFLISSTRLRGAFSLRICVLGFRTTEDDVRELVDLVREFADERVKGKG